MSSVVLGMGEVGSALYHVLEDAGETVYGFDLVASRCRGTPSVKCEILHVCVPYLQGFHSVICDYAVKYQPSELVIHSSVPPGTTEHLTWKGTTVYSPVRGVHKNMVSDLQCYTKFWAGTQTPVLFIQQMRRCNIKVEAWNDTCRSLELAKLLMDVVYYGWLIIFAQHVKLLACRCGVDSDKLWDFTDEIHKVLGNRPRMFSGKGINGHCILPDVELLNDGFLDAVFSHDKYYRRNLEATKNG